MVLWVDCLKTLCPRRNGGEGCSRKKKQPVPSVFPRPDSISESIISAIRGDSWQDVPCPEDGKTEALQGREGRVALS